MENRQPSENTHRSDGEVFQFLARSNGGLNPLGLQATAGPGFTGGVVAVLRGHLAASAAARGAGHLATSLQAQVRHGQAVFSQQRLDLSDHACAFSTTRFLQGLFQFGGLLVEGGFLGEEVLVLSGSGGAFPNLAKGGGRKLGAPMKRTSEDSC